MDGLCNMGGGCYKMYTARGMIGEITRQQPRGWYLRRWLPGCGPVAVGDGYFPTRKAAVAFCVENQVS